MEEELAKIDEKLRTIESNIKYIDNCLESIKEINNKKTNI